MAKKEKHEKQVAQASSSGGDTMSALNHQKMQLVNAFTELASSMRKAAKEAETMANTVANANLSEDSRVALQRNAIDMLKAVAAAPSITSPDSDHAMHGVVGGTSKKRGRPSATEAAAAKVAAPAPKTASPEANGHEKPEKVKKPRAKRDPDMPKKPATAYLLYQNEIREAVKQKHPEMTNQEILQEVSKRWQTISSEKKADYQEIVDKSKDVYLEKMKAYTAGKANQHDAAAPPPAPAPAKSLPQPAAAAQAPADSSSSEEDESESEESGSEESEEGSLEEEESESDDEPEQQPPPTKKHKSGPANPPIASVKSKKSSKK